MIETGYDRDESPAAPILAMRIRHPYAGRERTIPALLDTGASICCVDGDLANELDLPVAGSVTVEVAGGVTFECTRHLADVDVGLGAVRLVVTALADGCILGRDLLNRHVIVLHGPHERLRIET